MVTVREVCGPQCLVGTPCGGAWLLRRACQVPVRAASRAPTASPAPAPSRVSATLLLTLDVKTYGREGGREEAARWQLRRWEPHPRLVLIDDAKAGDHHHTSKHQSDQNNKVCDDVNHIKPRSQHHPYIHGKMRSQRWTRTGSRAKTGTPSRSSSTTTTTTSLLLLCTRGAGEFLVPAAAAYWP